MAEDAMSETTTESLRERYAEAMEDYDSWDHLIDKVVAVRDEEVERLRVELDARFKGFRLVDGQRLAAIQRAEKAEAELEALKAANLRDRSPNNPPCPSCGATHIVSPMARLPWRKGGQWWRCYGCFHRWSTEGVS